MLFIVQLRGVAFLWQQPKSFNLPMNPYVCLFVGWLVSLIISYTSNDPIEAHVSIVPWLQEIMCIKLYQHLPLDRRSFSSCGVLPGLR